MHNVSVFAWRKSNNCNSFHCKKLSAWNRSCFSIANRQIQQNFSSNRRIISSNDQDHKPSFVAPSSFPLFLSRFGAWTTIRLFQQKQQRQCIFDALEPCQRMKTENNGMKIDHFGKNSQFFLLFFFHLARKNTAINEKLINDTFGRDSWQCSDCFFFFFSVPKFLKCVRVSETHLMSPEFVPNE